jgi:hypothetical protein
MIAIDNVLVSEELLEEKFVCNLNACKGACCVEGDGGAPLSAEEAKLLEEIRENLRPHLTPEGNIEIDTQGSNIEERWIGETYWSTPLMHKRGACVYAVVEEGIVLCGIENAWKAGAVNFQKPISCHLYPIRVQHLEGGITALNYHRWQVCAPACENGEKLKVPVYQFLKAPLIRAFGPKFFKTLSQVAKDYLNYKNG